MKHTEAGQVVTVTVESCNPKSEHHRKYQNTITVVDIVDAVRR
jgi:hypothetical protein